MQSKLYMKNFNYNMLNIIKIIYCLRILTSVLYVIENINQIINTELCYENQTK